MIARESGGTLANGGEKRSWFGRLLRFFLEPVYYWLDLKSVGHDRVARPSYIKVAGLASFLLGCGLLVRLWGNYFQRIEAGKEWIRPTTGELGFLLAFSFLIFLLPHGLKGLQVWAQTRGGSTLDVLHEAATREPERLRAQAELEKTRAAIAERRAQGDGYEVTE